MFITALMSESGDDVGKWYAIARERSGSRRAGYCATGCVGHESSQGALAHFLQFQLDRETDLWLDRREPARPCEICGARTTLRARLGRKTKLIVLCTQHQSTKSLQALFERRLAETPEPAVR
jgi:hypothetical protein